MQAADRKNQNRQDMNANIAGLGQNLGGALSSIGNMIAEEKKKKIVAQILQAMQTQGAPQQGPPLPPLGTQPPIPGMGQLPPNLSPGPGVPSPPGGQQSMMPSTQIPPGQPMSAGLSNVGQDVQMPPSPPPQPIPSQGPGMPTSGIGGPPQDNTKLLQNLMMQYDPQKSIEAMMASRTQKQASPWRVVPGMMSPTGKPIQQNEQTGEVREAEINSPIIPTGRGNAALQNGLGGTGVRLTSPTDPSKSRYYDARATAAETGALSTIEKNIDPSVASRTTPVGAAATTVRRAINGLTLLNQPVVTKTALEATMSDVDAILTQGSATVEGRKMLNASNVYQNVAAYKSFVSSAPDKVQVPGNVVNIYRDILKDLAPVSEKFVKDRVEQQWNFYKSRGNKLAGDKQYAALKDRILNGFSVQVPEGGGQSGQGQPGALPPITDPGKQARYEAWKKANGY